MKSRGVYENPGGDYKQSDATGAWQAATVWPARVRIRSR